MVWLRIVLQNIIKIVRMLLFVTILIFFSLAFTGLAIVEHKNNNFLRISEESLFHIEKTVGLNNWYKDALSSVDSTGKCCKSITGKERGSVYCMMYISALSTLPYEIKDPERELLWRNNVLFSSDLISYCRYKYGDELIILCTLHLLLLIFSLCTEAIFQRRILKIIVIVVAFCLFYNFVTTYYSWQNFLNLQDVHRLTANISENELGNLLKGGTRIVTEYDGKQYFPKAEILCGNSDFFENSFLCWNLGGYSYLYYMPSGLQSNMFFQHVTQIKNLEHDFYLVQYPGLLFADNMNFLIYQALFWGTLLGFILITWVKYSIFAQNINQNINMDKNEKVIQ